ncbi:MAG: NUDIX hydrolase [Candidatus Uhrbacteria bacterium]
MVEWRPLEELPKKRLASGVLLFNDADQLLIVKPSYKNHWSIPGGIVDLDESPTECVVRECNEEVGISIRSPRLVCVDYRSADVERNEHINFVYLADQLIDSDIDSIEIDGDEIIEYKFVFMPDALKQISPRIVRLINSTGIDNKTKQVYYLENGEKI